MSGSSSRLVPPARACAGGPRARRARARGPHREQTRSVVTMSTDENKAIVRRFAEEILNEKRFDRADEIMAADYVDGGAMPGQAPGLEGFKRKGAMWVAAVPDLRVWT